MATPPLVTPELREEIRHALDNAMCGQTCYDLNCDKCMDARIDAAIGVMSKVPKLIAQEKWRQVKQLVNDGVLHKDALRVMEDLLRGWPK